MKIEFSGHFKKNTQISNFMKIRPMGAEFFRADRRTDIYRIVSSRNFANALKEPKEIQHESEQH
jgi:hypothetical protein